MISRRSMEILTAAATGIAGLVAVAGSIELGTGWSEHGPEPGYFPFWVGAILFAASLWNGVRATLADQAAAEEFLSREQALRILSFLGPMAAFVLISVFLGTYLGSAIYLVWMASRQGGLSLSRAIALGLGFSIALYVIFETVFQVPLHKGPLEAMLGIY